jgi:hypothetical protein
MIENGKIRVELNLILEKKPGFFIRWSLTAFVMAAILLVLLAHYAGYDILPLFGKR